MKRYLWIVLSLFFIILPGCSSDHNGEYDKDKTYNVLCLFVYDSVFQNYRIYEQTLSKSLSENGIKADIRNVYSSGHLDMAQSDALEASLERLNKENWIPDVVCYIDDRTLSLYLQGEYARWLPPVDSIPLVAAGLRCPDWALIRRSNNTAVCTDLLNFQRNIELAVRMAPYTAVPGRPMYPNVVVIELDTTDYDKRIRERLRSELDRPPYVNNMDYHVKDLSLELLSERYRDSIFINVFSNASPELNDYRSDGDYHTHRIKMLNSLTMTPFLTVKRDIENEQVLSKTLKPQFSAVRDGFADGSTRSLCGYFASYETVAKDQADYVARILKGEAAGSLPIMEHEAGYYRSWRAMELLNMDYNDFCDDFVIVNAPWRVQHPFKYVLFIIFDIVAFLFVLSLSLYLLFRKKDTQLQEALAEIDNERIMLDMALQNADCTVISSPDDLMKLEPMLHPDDSDAISELLATLASGKPVTARKFRLTKDGGSSYRWWQFRPNLKMNTQEHGLEKLESLSGIVIDINDAELYKKLSLARTHGITKNPELMVRESEGPWYYEEISLGYNYRMTDFQAALLMSQMDRIDGFVARRKEIVKRYNEAFADVPGIIVQKEIPGSDTSRHLYIIRLDLDKLKCTRREFFDAMSAENVQCQVHYVPVYWFPYYRHLGYEKGMCPNAEEIYKGIMSIPLYPKMSDKDVEDTIHAVKKLAEYYRK